MGCVWVYAHACVCMCLYFVFIYPPSPCTQITKWQGNFNQKQSSSTVPMLGQRAEANRLKEHSGTGSLFGALFCELSEEAELGTGAWEYGFLFPLTGLMM